MQEHETGGVRSENTSATDLLERLISEAEKGENTVSEGKETDRATPSPTQGSGGGFDLQWLTLLPQLMSGFQGLKNMGGTSEKNTDAAPAVAALTDTFPTKLPSFGCHMALLAALKPYLGAERRKTAEGLLGICRALDTMQKLGLSFPMPSHTAVEQHSEGQREEV